MPHEIRGRLPYLVLVAILIVLDRWTKALIDAGLALHQTIPVIDGFFNITYVRNTGVAFGILDSGLSVSKATALSVLTVVAIGGVLVYSWKTPLRQRLTQTALSMVLAGALGNLYDRVRFGYVIDFVELYFRTYRWPSFNIADSAISTGVALLAIDMLRKDAYEPPNRS